MEQREGRKHRNALAATAAILACGLLMQPIPAGAEQMTPLRGSATITQQATTGKAYYPRTRAIQRADWLTEQYKLDAAEEAYRRALEANPYNAGAYNGLGKIAFYRTTSNNQNLRDDAGALYDKAIQYYVKALALQPNYVEARLNLGTVYMEQGRLQDAAEEFGRAFKLAPGNADVLERMGAVQAEMGEDNAAKPFLEAALEAKPGHETAHYYLGRVSINRGEYDKAHKELQTALYKYREKGVEPAPVHYELGRLYQRQGNGAAAVNEFKEALRLKPELHKASMDLAAYYEQRGDYGAALEALKNVLASESTTHPAEFGTLDRMAKLSIQNKQPEVAAQYYQAWLNNRPGEYEREAKAGLSYAQTQIAKDKKRDDDLVSQGEARRQAEQALVFNPNNFEAKLIQTKLDKEIGKPDSAAYTVYGKPQDPGFINVALTQPTMEAHQSFKQGELLLYRYQFNQADAAFRTARRSAKTARETLVFGELFLEKSLPQLAEECFQHVLRFLPGNESARAGLAKANQARRQSEQLVMDARFHKRKGYENKAIQQAEEALKLNIRNALAHYYLGVWYENEKQYSRAADHYYAYVQLSPTADNRATVERRIEHLKDKMLRASR